MRNRLIATLCIVGALACNADAVLAADAAGATTSGTAASAPPARPRPVDINSAPSGALQKIPGIGEAEAAKIIAGRPYNSKADLVSRKIVSDTTYAAIRDRIIVRPQAPEKQAAKSSK